MDGQSRVSGQKRQYAEERQRNPSQRTFLAVRLTPPAVNASAYSRRQQIGNEDHSERIDDRADIGREKANPDELGRHGGQTRHEQQDENATTTLWVKNIFWFRNRPGRSEERR